MKPSVGVVIKVWLNAVQKLCKRERNYSFGSKNKALFTNRVWKLLSNEQKDAKTGKIVFIDA